MKYNLFLDDVRNPESGREDLRMYFSVSDWDSFESPHMDKREK